MLTLPPSVHIYLSTTATDMRKSIDGLLAIVRGAWQRDVFSGYLFVFASRRGDRIKILYWDHGGFVVFYKRLERGCFKLPIMDASSATAELEAAELALLLEGFDTRAMRRPKLWQPPKATEAVKTGST